MASVCIIHVVCVHVCLICGIYTMHSACIYTRVSYVCACEVYVCCVSCARAVCYGYDVHTVPMRYIVCVFSRVVFMIHIYVIHVWHAQPDICMHTHMSGV